MVTSAAAAGDERVVIRIDGARRAAAETIADLASACDKAEDLDAPLVIYVSGAPREPAVGAVSVALVSKWERALRRLERLRAISLAVATGDCGGQALDVLLSTDYRIAAASLRLLVPIIAGATWPGMALYRLTSQAGAGAVRQAALFGVPIDAARALALHLVDEVTEDPEGVLAAAPPLAGGFSGPEVAIRRQLMLDAATASFEDVLGTHLAACDRTLRMTADQVTSARSAWPGPVSTRG